MSFSGAVLAAIFNTRHSRILVQRRVFRSRPVIHFESARHKAVIGSRRKNPGRGAAVQRQDFSSADAPRPAKSTKYFTAARPARCGYRAVFQARRRRRGLEQERRCIARASNGLVRGRRIRCSDRERLAVDGVIRRAVLKPPQTTIKDCPAKGRGRERNDAPLPLGAKRTRRRGVVLGRGAF